MLRNIAVFSMQGFWQAATAITLMSLAAMMLPPLSYLVSGIIVLYTLSMGPKAGISLIAIAGAAFLVVAGLVFNQLYFAGLFLLSSWLPVWGISLVLGYSRSLAVSFLVAAAVGLFIVFASYLLLPDPTVWWQQMMAPLLDVLAQQPEWNEEQAQQFIATMAKMMTGIVSAGITLNLMLGLLLGRAWQAGLYNPGGFADEFQQLYLGKIAAGFTVLLAVLMFSSSAVSSMAQNCLAVMSVVFMVQGLAVAHSVVRQRQKHKSWLIVMYVLLFFMMPQMVLLLAMIGVLEQWFNFRRYSDE